VHGCWRVMFCNIWFRTGIADTLLVIIIVKLHCPCLNSLCVIIVIIGVPNYFCVVYICVYMEFLYGIPFVYICVYMEFLSWDRITSSHYALLFGDIHVLQGELYSYLFLSKSNVIIRHWKLKCFYKGGIIRNLWLVI